MIGVLFFILTVLCLPGLPDGAETPRWCLMSLLLPALFLWRNDRLSGTVALLLGYVALMLLRNPVWQDGAYLYWHLILYILAFYLFRNDLKQVTMGAALGMAVNSAVVIAQYYGWNAIPQLAPHSGLFYNRNLACEAAAMLVALCIGYRLWWFLPGLLPTLILGSRAPVLALGVVGVIAVWRYSRWFAAGIVAASGAMVAYLTLDFLSLEQRLGAWYNTAQGFTLLGRGLGSFLVEFPLFQENTDPLYWRFENAHNDALQLIFEFGLPGAIMIGAVLWRVATAKRSPAWYAFVVFFVEGCFGFPLYKPITGILAACCAGVVFGGWNPLRGLLIYIRLLLRARHQNRRFEVFPGVFAPISFAALAPSGTSLLGRAAQLPAGGSADRAGLEDRSERRRSVV
jgi:hypothetical protein